MPWQQWKSGNPITINRIVWDGLETEFINDVLERDWFGPGFYADKLEKELAKFVGTKYAQLTNSGSSALLLATKALQEAGFWREGDLILHPACTFPTSCNPIWQSGMIPVFVDVEEGTYNIDCDKVEYALQMYPKIKGAIVPHLLGNTTELDRLLSLLGENRLLIEDCCDTLGTTYDGKQVGTFGAASAFSFYGSHHITTAGVGGALLTNYSGILDKVKSMTFWGREFVNSGDAYLDFVKRYSYETIGYDMQMTEIQAAFGLAQMQRLEEMNKKRLAQYVRTDAFFVKWSDWFVLPKSYPETLPSWFGYPVLVKENAPFDREAFVRHLIEHKIEIRPLFAGNLTKHKAYRSVPYMIAGTLEQSDRNMERALFLPSWGGMTSEQTAYLFGVVEDFLERW